MNWQLTYIAENNLDASDRFLASAEETFKQLAKTPQMGKLCQLPHPQLAGVRQQAIKGFRKYLIFYRFTETKVEILRVLHGARDIAEIFEQDAREDEQ